EGRLYDRVLSAEEVKASYRAGRNGVTLEEVLACLTPEQRRQHETLSQESAKLRQEIDRLSRPPLAYAATITPPGPTPILLRGDTEKKGDQVAAGGLSGVKSPSPDLGLDFDAPEGQRRLKLAEWIASPDNPLTARVLVNRLWHHHFGRALAVSPSDFGFNGEKPSHPELLDWLASEFVREGWSIKKLHRLILLSSTYQESS